MNAAELQALRRLLFFSVPEAASMISGTSERAWKHWEAGARAVPDDVAEAIRELAEWREAAIDAALKAIDDGERGATEDDLEAIDLPLIYYTRAPDWTGEPEQWRPHQSACATLLAMDDRIRLVLFDGPAFAAWLGGRADSEGMRAAWAGQNKI